jgi:O-antigen/teichoic acid export membrane protein
MNFRCPSCRHRLAAHSLLFRDVSACAHCGQQVVLGEFLAFFMAALSMTVSSLATLYLLSHALEEYLVAAGYALFVGMAAGVVVLFLLGRAQPLRRRRKKRRSRRGMPLDGVAGTAAKA